MNKWARSSDWNNASAEPAGGGRAPRQRRHNYFAFLSYSHDDTPEADWLHKELERFRVPSSLAGRLTDNGVIPRRLTPIFRDRHELAAADDLGEEIQEALAASRCLIVLCSPAAAQSKWTNAEIETFKRLHPDGCLIAAIVAGEPFASETPGREQEECLPPALRLKYDRRGRSTGKRAEPLAADLRETGDGRRLGLLKIVAGMLGVGLDDLVQRDQLRRQRRLAGITGASVAGMVVALVLAVTAIDARDAARDQRREAEGLVAFMLGDLREKLEPIGKLDALDGVGARVLEYYSRQDTSALSDSGLLQRSRALNLTAEVAFLRGDVQAAERLYREAMDGTAEAVSRNPSDPQRLFDHAQNVFWVAQIAWQLGKLADAERGLREYKHLADQLVAVAPDNMKWRMEQQSAEFNLGILLYARRKFEEATDQFTRSLATMQALATADPQNTDYQVAVTESQSWLAEARAAAGQLGSAVPIREDLVLRLQRLLRTTGDVIYQQKLVPAERSLGELYWYRGQVPEALAHLRSAVRHADALLARESTSARWKAFSSRSRLALAEVLLMAGEKEEAARETAAACNVTARLIATDSTRDGSRADLRDCWSMRARLELADGDLQRALQFAQKAVEAAKSVRSPDRVDDKYALAQSYRLLGDARQRLRDTTAAQAAWNAALATLPAGVAEKPPEMAEHATILERIGRTAQSEQLRRRLASVGFLERAT